MNTALRTLYPVARELAADVETPVSAFYALKETGKPAFFLESVERGEWLGRYSFLGFEPELIFSAKGKKVSIASGDQTEEFESDNPVSDLKKLMVSYREERVEGLPPLCAGLVGYFSYDSVRYFEKLPDVKPDRLNLPDILLVLPKIVVAFDHIKQKLIFVAHSYEKGNQTDAIALIEKYESRLANGPHPSRTPSSSGQATIQMTANMRKDAFVEAVEKAKKHIVAGDIFQVVLSQQFHTKTELSAFDIYRKLRMINPSPYMFYMDFGTFELVGSSPEVMVKRTRTADTDEVIVRPIAGTRPRGPNAAEDQRIEHELLTDAKELAEHTMLLDLARNDVGKISEFGTVKVNEPFHIERYSHVMHIVSDVVGKPSGDRDALDIVGSTFPAGTVSGSPKVRAMEIIEDLEPEKRGVYAGAIGYIDFAGNVDTCIAIRTMVCKDKTVYVQAGAGIVYDSVPEREYQETLNKAKALMKALQ